MEGAWVAAAADEVAREAPVVAAGVQAAMAAREGAMAAMAGREEEARVEVGTAVQGALEGRARCRCIPCC